MPEIKAAILIRVSTKRQDTDRQEFDLKEEAARRGWTVTEVVAETISGSAEADAREGLDKIRSLVKKRRINKVMVHEITRIGRRPSVIHEFVEFLTEEKVSLYWHSQGMETLNPDGKPNQMASLLVSILAGLAKNETDVLSIRIRSGMEDARRKGIPIGRPEGKWEPSKLLKRHEAAVREIKLHPGLSVARLAKLGGISSNTVLRLKKILDGGELVQMDTQ